MSEKYYKKLKIDSDGKLQSPIQSGYIWPVKQWVDCPNFDDSDVECSRGLYYLKLHQLLFCPATPIYEVEIGGRIKEFRDKNRCEKMRIVGPMAKAALKHRIEAAGLNQDYNYFEALSPINPLYGKPKQPTRHDINLLKKWASVRDSVRASVWDSVVASVGDSVRAYTGSLFPQIEKWKYIDHKPGEYPFSSAAKVWRRGFVPSFDGTTWRLHSGAKAKIVYEWKTE